MKTIISTTIHSEIILIKFDGSKFRTMANKRMYLLPFFLWIFTLGSAQDLFQSWQTSQLDGYLKFLSSDELKGRDTGEPGNDIAARFIAIQFESTGLQPLPGTDSYLQAVKLARVSPQEHSVEWNNQSFDQGVDFLALSEGEFVGNLESVFVNHGISEEDYENIDVQGKLVIALTGDGENKSPQAAFGMRQKKSQLAQSKGALAVVEIFTLQMPWTMMVNFLNSSRLDLDNSDSDNKDPFFYGLINLEKEAIGKLTKGEQGKMLINYPGLLKTEITSNNVLGYIPGSDPLHRDDYIVLSAHFDHVGVGSFGNNPDTIFNGARDNGIGTVGVMAAAHALSKNPPKRSVIFAAWTGEEKGLLGSRYFVENCPVDLSKIRFNLNSDGGGYDDTTAIAIMGLTRVGAEREMTSACEAFGLTTIADPAPEQGLFDRSDNVNFAKVGIPAPTFSPGFSTFSKEITKYYHRPGDHYDSLNMRYVNTFWKAFTLAAYNIGNMENNPAWIAGDKYEEAFKKLYGSH